MISFPSDNLLPMNPLVTPAWLQARLADPATVVLDATLPPVGVLPVVDTRALYIDRHIPGAAFFDIEALSDHSSNLPHTMPTAENFAKDMAALGVGSDSTIVVYEQVGVFSAPRARWMLRAFGAAEVYILDGGLRAWIEAGFPVQSGEVYRPTALFQASLNPQAMRTFPDIQKLLAENAQILDARSAGRFAGTAPEPRPGLSSGHMPGATSVPFLELVRDGKLLPAAELRDVFSSKGVALNKPITTTCGSGVTAAVVSLGLEIAGAENVSLYDGSWAEYAQNPAARIVKS